MFYALSVEISNQTNFFNQHIITGLLLLSKTVFVHIIYNRFSGKTALLQSLCIDLFSLSAYSLLLTYVDISIYRRYPQFDLSYIIQPKNIQLYNYILAILGVIIVLNQLYFTIIMIIKPMLQGATSKILDEPF